MRGPTSPHLRAVQFRHIAWIFWLLLCLKANGQQPFQFKHIKDGEGLLGNLINCFHQDKDGFLWIGTYDGLKRYSGGHTKVFRPDRRDSTSVANIVIHKIAEDKAGRIWLATGNGISFFDKQKNNFTNIYSYKNKPLAVCNNILCGADGNIWFSSNAFSKNEQEIFKYHFETNTLELIAKFPPKAVVKNGFAEDRLNKGIWIGTTTGMHFYDYQTKTLQHYLNNPNKISILNQHAAAGLAIDGNQLLFLDNQEGELVFFDLVQKKVTKTLKPKSKIKHPYFDAATTFVDKNHHVWIATWHYELFYIEPEHDKIIQIFHNKTNATSIAADFIWGGWISYDGSIWLGTTNGISIYNPEQSFYKLYDVSQLFPALDEEFGIGNFIEDTSNGVWWLGTNYRGLIRYSPQKKDLKVLVLPNKTELLPYGGQVKNLLEYQEQLYFISGNALYRFDKKTETFKQLNTQPILNSLHLQHQKLWVLTDRHKVASYHIPSNTWKEYNLINLFSDHNQQLDFPFVDTRGRYGILTDKEGVFFYNQQTDRFEVVRGTHGLNLYTYNSFLLPEASGDLWFYGRDILKINLSTLQTQTFFEKERIGHAVLDNKQNHWLGLYNQFTVVNPKTKLFKQFELPFGVDNSKYDTKMFKLKNGNILACLKGVIIEFLSDKLTLKPPVGSILLDKISLADSSFLLHSDSTRVALKSNQNTFTVYHGMLDQYDQTTYQYYYQLVGESDKWMKANASSVTFTNLDGGDYTYRIKAIRADGQSTAIRTLIIHLDTIFFKTWWFKSIIGTILLGILFSFLSYRANQRKRIHHLELQSTRLEKDKTEIQYQNLINHLNPHFLFNSLTSLNSLIITEPKTASKFLQKLSAMYRYILQSKDKETVTLEEELNFVKNYIELQQSRFEQGLIFQINIEEKHLDDAIVPVTLQNLFENAIKHNIIEDDSPLRIIICVEGEYLVVKNNLQKKKFVDTSNKQGLDSLKKLYSYLTAKPFESIETHTDFIVKVPLL